MYALPGQAADTLPRVLGNTVSIKLMSVHFAKTVPTLTAFVLLQTCADDALGHFDVATAAYYTRYPKGPGHATAKAQRHLGEAVMREGTVIPLCVQVHHHSKYGSILRPGL
jgi:hypothetical protein